MMELNEMDMASRGRLTRFKTLRHDYEHHMEEEEKDIFKTAREVMGNDTDGSMADKFERRMENERRLVDRKAECSLEE